MDYMLSTFLQKSAQQCKRGTRSATEIKIEGGEQIDDDGKGAERMKFTKECAKDGNRACYPGEIHCAPGLGGGCCPRNYPVCCGTGRHCRKYGPC